MHYFTEISKKKKKRKSTQTTKSDQEQEKKPGQVIKLCSHAFFCS